MYLPTWVCVITYYLHSKSTFFMSKSNFFDGSAWFRICFGSLDPDPHCGIQHEPDPHWNQCGSATQVQRVVGAEPYSLNQCCGSMTFWCVSDPMPLTNRSGSGCGFGSAGFVSGSCCFRYWPSRHQKKTNFLNKVFLFIIFEGTFTSFFKDKKSKRSHKTVGIKVFPTIFAW